MRSCIVLEEKGNAPQDFGRDGFMLKEKEQAPFCNGDAISLQIVLRLLIMWALNVFRLSLYWGLNKNDRSIGRTFTRGISPYMLDAKNDGKGRTLPGAVLMLAAADAAGVAAAALAVRGGRRFSFSLSPLFFPVFFSASSLLLLCLLSSLPTLFSLLLPLLFPLSPSSFLFSPPPFFCCSSSIYRAREHVFFIVEPRNGSYCGWSGTAVQACLPQFRRCGRWSANVFGRWARGTGGRWA
ncbi:hypothetical protein D5086_031187 [Populus alba]|uniref:Uncharacterized protein n=1 Tax=Populus alba TaxID=43335 RepID=A0ACC4ARG0_POPAL